MPLGTLPLTEGNFFVQKTENPTVSLQWIAVFPKTCYHKDTAGRGAKPLFGKAGGLLGVTNKVSIYPKNIQLVSRSIQVVK